MEDLDEIIAEFLVESHENLDQLDSDLVALEQDPTSRQLLGAIFRTIHTIKGTTGFLEFGRLEALTHAGEGLLSKLRDGELRLTAEITGALLTMVDASSIRVDVDRLDSLMRLMGELVLTRNHSVAHAAATGDATLVRGAARLNLITTELQEVVLRMRMQPIDIVWNNLPRVVRDLGAACGKLVRLEMEGRETELDKTILEAVKDP